MSTAILQKVNEDTFTVDEGIFMVDNDTFLVEDDMFAPESMSSSTADMPEISDKQKFIPGIWLG